MWLLPLDVWGTSLAQESSDENANPAYLRYSLINSVSVWLRLKQGVTFLLLPHKPRLWLSAHCPIPCPAWRSTKHLTGATVTVYLTSAHVLLQLWFIGIHAHTAYALETSTFVSDVTISFSVTKMLRLTRLRLNYRRPALSSSSVSKAIRVFVSRREDEICLPGDMFGVIITSWVFKNKTKNPAWRTQLMLSIGLELL